jgi:hypothetical protein
VALAGEAELGNGRDFPFDPGRHAHQDVLEILVGKRGVGLAYQLDILLRVHRRLLPSKGWDIQYDPDRRMCKPPEEEGGAKATTPPAGGVLDEEAGEPA